jgi:hypothetical protein
VPAPPTTTIVPIDYEGFYLVISSNNLAANAKNATVLAAIRRDLAAKFGISNPDLIRLVPTATSSSQVSLFFGIDPALVPQAKINQVWDQIKADTKVSWMKDTRTELALLGAPMNNPVLVSAMSADEAQNANRKPMGYCSDPGICAATVIGGLIVAVIVFYALFKYQQRQNNDEEGDERRVFAFDGRTGSASANFDGAGDGEQLVEELSAMNAATLSRLQGVDDNNNNNQQLVEHDPFADEYTSFFEQQGFGSTGNGIMRSSGNNNGNAGSTSSSPRSSGSRALSVSEPVPNSRAVELLKQDMEFV